MEERSIRDRTREIGGEAAARRVDHVHGLDHAPIVEADLVVDEEIVPLAGDRHVVVAVGAAFHGAAELLRRQRRDAGEGIALRLLAAEGAAHAPHLDRHGVRRHAEHMRHHVLDFARMLRRGIDGDLVILARHRERHLALEIEMLLAADQHRALQPARSLSHRGCDIAAFELQRLGDEGGLQAPRILDGDDGLQLLIGHLGEKAGAPRGIARLSDDGKDRLAVIGDELGCEQRLVVPARRADVVHARNIGGRQDAEDARRGANGVEIERFDLRVRPIGEPEIGMQQPARLRQVVDIERLARHMLMRGVMGQRLMHLALGGARRRGCAMRLARCDMGSCEPVLGRRLRASLVGGGLSSEEEDRSTIVHNTRGAGGSPSLSRNGGG